MELCIVFLHGVIVSVVVMPADQNFPWLDADMKVVKQLGTGWFVDRF